MRFQSKMLNKTDESGIVYVLMADEESNPVAVVTSEKQANLFMAQNKAHNWYRFTVDELPENVQPVPALPSAPEVSESKAAPAPAPPPQNSNEQDTIRKLNETMEMVDRNTRSMQQLLQKTRRGR